MWCWESKFSVFRLSCLSTHHYLTRVLWGNLQHLTTCWPHSLSLIFDNQELPYFFPVIPSKSQDLSPRPSLPSLFYILFPRISSDTETCSVVMYYEYSCGSIPCSLHLLLSSVKSWTFKFQENHSNSIFYNPDSITTCSKHKYCSQILLKISLQKQ